MAVFCLEPKFSCSDCSRRVTFDRVMKARESIVFFPKKMFKQGYMLLNWNMWGHTDISFSKSILFLEINLVEMLHRDEKG